MSQDLFDDDGFGIIDALTALDGLWKVWDPIGVYQDRSWPTDEYTQYSRTTWFFLKVQAAPDVILRFFEYIETDWMGLFETPDRRARREAFVQILIEWFERFQARDPQARADPAIAHCVARLPNRGDSEREHFFV